MKKGMLKKENNAIGDNMKTIDQIQDELFCIHNETLQGMMRELFDLVGKRYAAFCEHNQNHPAVKSMMNAMRNDGAALEETMENFKGVFHSKSNNFYTTTRNYMAEINQDISDTLVILNENESHYPDEETMQRMINLNIDNQKINDFYAFYVAFKDQTHIDQINQMAISLLLINDDQIKKKQLENWLVYVSVFDLYTDYSSALLSKLNIDLARVAFNYEILTDNLKPMDFFILYRQLFTSKELMYRNYWVFLALFKVLQKMNDEEFKFVFKSKSIVMPYSCDLYKRACETADYQITHDIELIEIAAKANVQGDYVMNITEESNCKLNFLYLMYISAFYNFLKLGYPNFSKYDGVLINVFISGREDCFRTIIDISNEISKEIRILSDNPFRCLNLNDIRNAQHIEDALVHLIHTFLNYSNTFNLDVLQMINFIDHKKEKFFKSKIEIDRKHKNQEEALEYYKKTQIIRDNLAKIDCGFLLDVKQTLSFLRCIDKSMFVDRIMKVKVFFEADMKLYSSDGHELDYIGIDPTGEENHQSPTGTWWKNKPLEDFRKKNKKMLDTIYLYHIRNQETHFDENTNIAHLLNDSNGRKRQFLEAVYDGINKMQELCYTCGNNVKDQRNQVATLHFWGQSIDRNLKIMFNQIKKDKLQNYTLKEVFAKDGSLNENITDEQLNRIKFKANIVPDYFYDNLKELLSFMYGMQPNLIQQHRFEISYYLTYLTLAIIDFDRKRF